MLRRWHILLLILVTLAAFCGLAAAKLRATPKYDRIQVGMTQDEVKEVLGDNSQSCGPYWDLDEGRIVIDYQEHRDEPVWYSVLAKTIDRRGPLERLAWLAGWR